MGSLGFTEIMVVLLVALIVLGPARLPDAARSMGKAMRELRKLSSGFEREVRAAFEDDGAQPSAARVDHGIDPGALAPGMSYGRPVNVPAPPPSAVPEAPAPRTGDGAADPSP